MKKNIFILFFIFSSFLFASRIPVDENKIRITSTFGEFRTDHFHNGLDFGGYKLEIFPIDDGEVVYYFDAEEDPTKQVFGVGNNIILEHTNNLRSYYYHLEDGTIQKTFAKVTEQNVIALTGNTGRSGGPHLHLVIEDMKNGRVIDPFDYLKLPKNANTSPLIHGIYLRTETRLIQIKDRMPFKYNGELKLFVKAYDLLGNITVGLKRVRIFINDTLVRDYDFSYFIKRDNIYLISPDYLFEDVYGVDSHFYRGGVFTPKRGTYTFKAEVVDFDDNIVTLTRTVNFQ